uniref:THH1/TOM1/TOM3 domain-containing protein n=1 Tax=Corethron hystrix TaxID=216773 RepID=A0A7S1B4V3_9STRA|mmetsp:Transcript_12970/g.28636  ORF Transcript_12970/g.28636 Transcript_12970/m.28636 type:complete len:445 (+) Transcript_12970:109-1443(+)
MNSPLVLSIGSIPHSTHDIQSYVGLTIYFILFIISSIRLITQCGGQCGCGGPIRVNSDDSDGVVYHNFDHEESRGAGLNNNRRGTHSIITDEEKQARCCPPPPGGKRFTLRKIVHASVWTYAFMELLRYSLITCSILTYYGLESDERSSTLYYLDILATSTIMIAFSIKTLLWAKPAVGIKWKNAIFFFVVLANIILILQSILCANDLHIFISKETHSSVYLWTWRVQSKFYRTFLILQTTMLVLNALATAIFGLILHSQIQSFPSWNRIDKSEQRMIFARLFLISTTCFSCYVLRAGMLVAEFVGIVKYGCDWTGGWSWTACKDWIPNILTGCLILYAMRKLDRERDESSEEVPNQWANFSENIYGHDNYGDDEASFEGSFVASGAFVDSASEINWGLSSRDVNQTKRLNMGNNGLKEPLLEPPPIHVFPPQLSHFSPIADQK